MVYTTHLWWQEGWFMTLLYQHYHPFPHQNGCLEAFPIFRRTNHFLSEAAGWKSSRINSWIEIRGGRRLQVWEVFKIPLSCQYSCWFMGVPGVPRSWIIVIPKILGSIITYKHQPIEVELWHYNHQPLKFGFSFSPAKMSQSPPQVAAAHPRLHRNLRQNRRSEAVHVGSKKLMAKWIDFTVVIRLYIKVNHGYQVGLRLLTVDIKSLYFFESINDRIS